MLTHGIPFRSFAWLGFFAIILAAWWVMYDMATDMGMTLTGGMSMEGMPMGEMAQKDAPMGSMPMDNTMPSSDTTGAMPMNGMASDGMPMMDMPMNGPMMGMNTLTVLIPMWVIMMAAMMGPTFVPTARTYEDLIGRGAGTRAGFVGLVGGYLGVWFGFGALIAVAHFVFLDLELLTTMGTSQSVLFSAALLAVAGIYQFTPAKEFCLSYCRSPMVHFLARWRDGAAGGAIMGGRIGIYCIACCWAIMLLGFVGGAMNLLWMGIATIIMTLEKLPDLGRWTTRPLGVAFLAASVWQITKLI